MPTQDSFIELKPRILRRAVSAFVGTRLSFGAGLPDWYELVSELADYSNYQLPPRRWMSSESLSSAFQAYTQMTGTFSVISFLKENFDTTGMTPTDAHYALARLPINTVFTTGYDNLLELAYRDIGKQFHVIANDEATTYLNSQPDTVAIIKLCGDIDNVRTLILPHQRDKLEELIDERSHISALLWQNLTTKSMLYLGLSYLEPHFNQLFYKVVTQRHRYAGYAAMCELPAEKLREMEEHYTHIIDLPPAEDENAQLASWLDQLLPPPFVSTTPVDNTTQTGGKSHNVRPTKPYQRDADNTPQNAPDSRDLGPIRPEPPKLDIVNHGQAWALLVGINHYEDPHIADLKAAMGDVTALGQMFMGNYQAVRLLTDEKSDHLPTRANILSALSVMAQAAGEDDLLLFHFSGHGIAEEGEGYLLPRDARAAVVSDTGIAMARVRAIMNRSPARAKVIVLDACHSGASIGRESLTMTPEFIIRVFAQAEGFAVLASCKQGQRSYEWAEKGYGVFTYFLLEALGGKADLDQKGFVTVSDVSRYVTNGVKQWSVDNNAPQTPTLEYRVAGDIVILHQRQAK